MSKVASHKAKVKINSVALEGQTDQFDLTVKQEVAKVDALSSTGPEKVVGNYDWNNKLSGQFDGASGNIDATLFGLVGSTGVALDFDPTGTVAGANNPHYTGTLVLTDLTISAKVGAGVMESASFDGASALTRAVA